MSLFGPGTMRLGWGGAHLALQAESADRESIGARSSLWPQKVWLKRAAE